MWKRLTALLFVLILGGQVWAGVCGCFENSSTARMKCCLKKQKSSRDTLTRTKCCDGPCGLPADERAPRSVAEAGMKLPVIVHIPEVKFDFRPRLARYPTTPVLNAHLRIESLFARPPNLYLQNQSFLI